MKLIEYAKEIATLYDVLSYSDDEAEQADAVSRLDSVELGYLDKLENCAWMYRQLLADAEGYKVEANRLHDKSKRAEKNAERLKDYISYCLQGSSVKTQSFNLCFRKSKQVVITGDVPDQYMRVKTTKEPDKTLLKQDLESGADLSFAKLQENLNLQIK